jgi:hypothetical protein
MTLDLSFIRPGRAVRKTAALVLGAALVAGAGCTSNMGGQGTSYLIVDSIKAASGAKPTEMSGALASDVVTRVKVEAGFVDTFFEDPAQVSFSLALKDPGGVDSPTVPSSTNFITVDRYHVEFVRADGRNTQGVDVPYAFDGAFTATVSAAGNSATFILVREQAKLEAPLMALRGGGGAISISTIAKITFYGHDQAGHQVTATGQISVNFADWGDPS